MALYFCIHDVLTRLDKENSRNQRMHTMVPVFYEAPSCDGFKEDAFNLSSFPKILNLVDDDRAVHQLALLLSEAPLYKKNLLLLLDDALAERHYNQKLQDAFLQIFRKEPFPALADSADNAHSTDITNLKHPSLNTLDNIRLSEVYIALLKNLGTINHFYGFEANIIGKNTPHFLEQYDGFADPHGGKIKADILIGFGSRQDYRPTLNPQNCLEEGYNKAMKMDVPEARELLWAWLEADHYQMRRCFDIDRLLRLEGLPRIPSWVHSDILSMLEKEAMKQIFAKKYFALDQQERLLNDAQKIKASLAKNAKREIDGLLEKLMEETLNVGASYKGTAGQFYQLAQDRRREARIQNIA